MERATPSPPTPTGGQRPFVVILALAIVVGLGVGVAGAGLVCLLHLVQHGAYGYDVGSVLDTESFLVGVTQASPLRRACAVVTGGLIAGFGWWALHRFGRPLVKVEEAVEANGRMPPGSTIFHALLQIVTVGLGSPLGRETAPREVGATFATWVSDRAKVSPEQRRLIVACAAGAGLAAVYNVPFAGALFTLEVLLETFRFREVVAALVSSALAALVVRECLHGPQVYELAPFAVHASLLVWSILVGPVLGIAAREFARLASASREQAPKGAGLVLWCLPTFAGIAVLATRFPQLLGNGKNVVQPGLAGQLTIGLAAVLLALRFAVTIGSLRAGAKGGLMTPSLALGALLGIVLGGMWSVLWPGTPLAAFAVVGATAFLAASQKMPVTAIVLMAEFARFDHDTLFAVLLAVAGASASLASRWARTEHSGRGGRPLTPSLEARILGLHMKTYDKHYIGGEWTPPSGKGCFDVIDASTEEVMGRVPAGDAADVDRAVRAAKAAFEGWSRTPPAERATYLQKIQAGIAARTQEIAETIAGEVGMPLPLSTMIQAGLPTLTFGASAELASKYVFEEQVGNSLVVKEAVGVVGCITPWNYPLHQIAAKVGPALAAGCTVVLKPSEVAPLSAFILAEIIDAAKLPRGVFNLVSGDGQTVGEAISGHPDVDMVSFTGSTRAGKRVGELAAQTVKRVALELGGKSANVILEDADLAKAVKTGVQNCYLNSGQTCSAWTRMLVPRAKHDEAVAIAKKAAEAFTPGSAHDAATRLGPLVSKTQQERVRGYIKKGIEEGATLVTGGAEQPEGLPKGYFVRPTVFANVKNGMTIAQQEIFGPVLCIIPYEDEEDAVRIANDSPYGLAGGVWSADAEHAKRVARRIRAGQVDINGGAFNPGAPFGGFKQSGRGREYGKWGFEEFLEVKSLQV